MKFLASLLLVVALWQCASCACSRIGGSSATYTFCTENSTLIVTGSSAMDEDFNTRVTSYAQKIRTILIREGITAIPQNAFRNFTVLELVSIPSTVKTIGECAFCLCPWNATVTVDAENTYFKFENQALTYNSTAGKYLVKYFGGNNSEYTVPGSITSIGKYAFANTGVMKVVINDALQAIGDFAFAECPNLQEVVFPASSELIFINQSAFDDCPGLTSVVLPNSVMFLGVKAFAYCSSLQSVTLSADLVEIGNDCFKGCDVLPRVTIPSKVQVIGNWSFASCKSLTSVTFAPGSNLSYIGVSAFAACDQVSELIIPETVTTIEKWAFAGWDALLSVNIPPSLKVLGKEAFAGCSNLETVEFYGDASPAKCSNDVFNKCPNVTCVTVFDAYSGTTFGGAQLCRRRLTLVPKMDCSFHFVKTTDLSGTFEYFGMAENETYKYLLANSSDSSTLVRCDDMDAENKCLVLEVSTGHDCDASRVSEENLQGVLPLKFEYNKQVRRVTLPNATDSLLMYCLYDSNTTSTWCIMLDRNNRIVAMNETHGDFAYIEWVDDYPHTDVFEAPETCNYDIKSPKDICKGTRPSELDSASVTKASIAVVAAILLLVLF